MSSRLKDWRAIVMRYPHCSDLFLSANGLATTLIIWLRRWS